MGDHRGEGATLAPIDGYQLIKRNDLWNGFTEPAATHAGWNFIRYIYAYRVKAGADSVVMLWIYSHGQFGRNNPPTVPPAAERMRAFREALAEAKAAQS